MTILLFTGWSAAGKSTIARRLGEDLEMPVVGARKVLHQVANKRGFTRIRYWLAANGIEEVLNEGLLAGLEEIRASRGTRGVIWDDAFDPRLPLLLRREFGEEEVVIIAVDTPPETREERLEKRLGTNREEVLHELRFIDGFKSEAGIAKVIEMANIKIKNFGSLEEALSILEGCLRGVGVGERKG